MRKSKENHDGSKERHFPGRIFPINWEPVPYHLGHIPEYSKCRHRVCPASTSSSRSVRAGSCRRDTFMVQGQKANSRKPADDGSRRCWRLVVIRAVRLMRSCEQRDHHRFGKTN
jgi:hypothetical protein